MLRLNRKLSPRISNQLAAVSAVLLFITVVTSSTVGSSELSERQASNLTSQTESSEPRQRSGTSQQSSTRKNFKISSLIFRHN
jgi:hypothetical protein